MSTESDRILRESMERRVVERYVSTAEAKDRAAFVGTSGHADWKSVVATMVLGAWPRVKAIPVLGPTIYSIFTWLRRTGR